MAITAYDLARDMAKEIAGVAYDIPFEWIDGEPCASLDEGSVLPVIETMILKALRDGGIKSHD